MFLINAVLILVLYLCILGWRQLGWCWFSWRIMALCAWLNNCGWQINPATNFAQNNPLVSFCASTGLLAFFPQILYQIAQVTFGSDFSLYNSVGVFLWILSTCVEKMMDFHWKRRRRRWWRWTDLLMNFFTGLNVTIDGEAQSGVDQSSWDFAVSHWFRPSWMWGVAILYAEW